MNVEWIDQEDIQEAVDSFLWQLYNLITIVMTFVTDDMTLVFADMTVWHHSHQKKVSCYDKIAAALWWESESAGYVKVKL